jgi:anti-sigma factor RsiW
MNKDLLNILLNSNKDIDNQQLMDYLAGKLSEEEKHAVEMQLAENDFMSDAVEGLEIVKNKRDINVFVDQLNRDLHKKLFRKSKKQRRKAIQQRWTFAAIILILALLLAAWLMIVKYQRLRHG